MSTVHYDPPTYRQYDNPKEQWLEWKRQAHAIGLAEAYRHASVSTSNRHRCRECFCCACEEYRRECLSKSPKMYSGILR